MGKKQDASDEKNWPLFWKGVCSQLEGKMVTHQLQTWIYPLNLKEWIHTEDKHHFFLLAPNEFSAHWITEHYKSVIEQSCTEILKMPCEITIEPTPVLSKDPPGKNALLEIRAIDKKEAKTRSSYKKEHRKPLPPLDNHDDGIDSRYIFDNYVVGASNQFAHACAVSVAEHPGKQYNPLFLYSPPGLGKTHLLHAVGNRLLATHSKARVLYLSAERFVNELIEALQHRKMQEFRSKYRDSFDLLLIDDIQFIAGKNTSEEEFFHTFNALHSSKRQIVISSDRQPKDIEGLAERIRTRFEWGLVTDIHPPEIETRIAILKTKAEQDDIYLPNDAAVFLATQIKSNVRELEGVLIRLQAKASLTGTEISCEMVQQELKNYIPKSSNKELTIETIQSAVAKHYRMRISDFKASTRSRNIVLPRQIAIYLVRKYTTLGLKIIGSHFGGKDHSTIMHACKKIESSLLTDPDIQSAIKTIQDLL